MGFGIAKNPMQHIRWTPTFLAPAQLASLVVARTTPPEELAAMRQLFESLDTDSTGTISYEKLHKGLDEKCHVRYKTKPHRKADHAWSAVVPR